MDKLQLISEAYKRGLPIPEDKKLLYEEAVRRGLVEDINPPTDQSLEQDYPKRRAISNIYRPALEGGGLVAGGTFGTMTGGPVAGVAGGGLGYSIGSSLSDRLDEFLGLSKKAGFLGSTKKAAKDIRTGAAYEMGGQAAGPAIKATGKGVWLLAEKTKVADFLRFIKSKFPSMSDKGVLKKAQQVLDDMRSDAPPGKVAESDEILKRAGVKSDVSYAQKSGSYQSAVHEQSVASKDAEIASYLKSQDAKVTQEATKGLATKFDTGKTIEDTVGGIEAQRKSLQMQKDISEGLASKYTNQLRTGQTPQTTGENIRASLAKQKKSTYETIKLEYDKIPKGIELDNAPLKKSLKTIADDFKIRGGGSQSMPEEALVKQIRESVKTGGITFDKLRDIRSQVLEEIRFEVRKADPNLKMVRRLNMLEQGVDDAMEQMAKLGDKAVVEQYRKASTMYRQYDAIFRKGAVGDSLQPGRQSNGYKIGSSDIPTRFFKGNGEDTAQDLVNALGEEQAGKIIDDFVGYDLLSRAASAGTFNAKTATAWLTKNKNVLERYGLHDKYKNIVKMNQISDEIAADVSLYEKGVASKIIGTDIDDIISNVFSGVGKKRSGATMADLLNMPGVAGDKAAINGIKTSFKDFLLQRSQNSGIDIMGNPLPSIAKYKAMLREYEPGINILYKDEPEKIKALNDYLKVLEILDRNKAVSYSKSSTTMEKMSGTGTLKSIGRNIAQLIAVQQGKGWFFSSLKNLWSAIFGAPRRYSEAKIEALLKEAIVNPDVAKTIMSGTKPNVNKTLFDRQIKHHLITLGIYEAVDDKEGEQQ